MFFLLICLLNFGVNAFPIQNNTLDHHNSTFDRRAKVIPWKFPSNHISVNLNISSINGKIEIPKDLNLTEIVKDLKDVGINELKDDQHIEGLPLDRHGKINPHFHKEIFLGNHELFESEIQHDARKRNKKLEEIFNLADEDHNERLSHEELLAHVFKNIQQHLQEAKDQNSRLFLLIDTNRNGKVTWQEYAALYVQFHHMNESDIRDLDDINFIQQSFDENLQQELLKIRFRWTEADGGGDNELTLDEFLEFRHPEMAGRSHKYIVDDIIARLDEDDDLKLNQTEFVLTPSQLLEDGSNKEWLEIDQRRFEEQKIEFDEMDEDKDGLLSREELLKAYDPLNRVHINIQIKLLFSKVDDSPKDNSLSLDEIQKHADVFTDMRILDPTEKLHDEM